MDQDEVFMGRAFTLAKKGMYTTAPNPSVGCVIVKDNKIISEGYHHKAGDHHAEIDAMSKLSLEELKGSTAYVTLEPCSHSGLTPPCAKALVKAQVKRVVCEMLDPNPLVSGNGIRILKEAGIETLVLNSDISLKLKELNRYFLHSMIYSKPYLTLKVGMSLDGKIALKSKESKWITSQESRQDVQRLRALNQAILTTSATIKADNPSLSFRYDELSDKVKENYPKELARNLTKVILDPKEEITGNENIFKTPGNVILVRLSKEPKISEEKFLENSIILRVPAEENSSHIDLNLLLNELHQRRIRSVLVEAGGRFVGELINKNLVDELVVYLAPKLLGREALTAFNFSSPKLLKDAKEFTLNDTQTIGNDIRLTYRKIVKDDKCLQE